MIERMKDGNEKLIWSTVAPAFLILILHLCSASLLAQHLQGEWVGGSNAISDWRFVQARFSESSNGITGSFDAQSANIMRMPMQKVTLRGADLRFELNTPLGVYVVEGKLSGATFSGTVTPQSGTTSKIHLVRTNFSEGHDNEKNERFAGVYTISPMQVALVTLRPFGQISISVIETIGGTATLRRSAMLIPKSKDLFFTSGSVIRSPDADEYVKFDLDESDAVVGLTWEQKGGDRLVGRKTLDLRIKAVRFNNGPITMNGTLVLPSKSDRPPAMVFVPGAGATTADGPAAFLRAWQFAARGWAVLLYDKRGTGHASGGYWSDAAYSDWAADAVAAFRFLKGRSEIDATRIGFQGNSEAGWVIPLAASRVPETAFVIIASGGGITPAESEVHEAEMAARAANMAQPEINEATDFVKLKWQYALTGAGWPEYEAKVKSVQRRQWFSTINGPVTRDVNAWREFAKHKHFDPVSDIRTLKAPTLLLFGEPGLDRLYPVAKGIPIWEREFKATNKSNYAIRNIAGVGHAVFLRTLNGRTVIVPEAFDAVTTWLALLGGQ